MLPSKGSDLNDYEKAFVDRISRLKISGPKFAILTKEALEAEYGGEGDELVAGLDRQTLEDPTRFAVEFYNVFGSKAMEYFGLIVKYAESGNFRPEEEAELEHEEEELESVIEDVESNTDRK